MTGGGLQEFVEHQLLKAYPNLHPEWVYGEDGRVLKGPLFFQLDAGPDRYTDCSLQWRAQMWEKCLILFPGLPNGTAANQVCDDLFGPYKTACSQVIDDLVSDRVIANQADHTKKVGLDFCDLGHIINGNAADPSEKRPFSK